MIKGLSKIKHNIYWYDVSGKIRHDIPTSLSGDLSNITGDVTNISGDVSPLLTGDVSNLKGSITYITGDATNINGDVTNLGGSFNDCDISTSDRKNKININDLIDSTKELKPIKTIKGQ